MDKKTHLPVGSVSEGTTKAADLAGAFFDAADGIRMRRYDRNYVTALRNKFDPDDFEAAADTAIELEQILAEYVPDWCYFGVADKGGTLWGVWPDWVRVGEARDSGEIAWSREDAHPRQNFAFEVNDHGNGTMWRRAGNQDRWKILWAVV